MRKVKLIVHETYQGKLKSEDAFAAQQSIADSARTESRQVKALVSKRRK